MKTIKGPAVFLAQFVDSKAPFNTLDGMCKWAADLGYKGIQIPTWEHFLIDLDLAAESQTYCDDLKGKINSYGLEITELSTHLQGQLVAVHPAYDIMFDNFAPDAVKNNPKARTEWAVETVKKAIEYTDVDFGVIYGVRDLETQKKLFESGKSQTMKSKHLIQEDGYAHAVDLMAYDGSNPSWDIVDYDNIADAMRKAAKEVGIDIVWGAAWHKILTMSPDSAEDLMNDYIDTRRKESRRPFIDGPHFQLHT